MGSLLLAYAVLFVLGSIATVIRYPPHSLKDLVPVFAACLVLVSLGLGVYRAHRWAAVSFSILTLYLAALAVRNAIHSVPWSWDGIGYWFALVLIMPTVVTVKFWSSLRQVPGPTSGSSAQKS